MGGSANELIWASFAMALPLGAVHATWLEPGHLTVSEVSAIAIHSPPPGYSVHHWKYAVLGLGQASSETILCLAHPEGEPMQCHKTKSQVSYFNSIVCPMSCYFSSFIRSS